MKASAAVAISLALLIPAAVLAQTAPNSLSVADCGASGSEFQTAATVTAGSRQITVADPGDFRVGQGVMISKCNTQFTHGTLWGPAKEYLRSAPLKDLVQLRGYDGSLGGWTVYVLDVDGNNPATFRWSDDLCRTWKQTKVPITGDWQKLSGGTEVKFGQLDCDSGYAVTFSARDQLLTTIEAVAGRTLTLHDAPSQSAQDAIVRHNDTDALQAVVDQAIKEKRNVFFPAGTYRLARPILVKEARGISLEGANGVDTVLDISEGEGACFDLQDGTEVNIRNFRLVGNTGFEARDQAGYLSLLGAQNVWGFYLKPCHGIMVTQTERVLVENCHASKMSGECFYCSGRARVYNQPEPAQYTKSLTWLRCSVTDSARNAFNNNDMAENTSVLQCRIVHVGGCAWEGASRFVRFIGNYVRNSGTVAMGNVRSRDEQYEQLGTGQHIVSDNVFEGVTCYGGAAIRAAACATQVLITNNIFVNYNSSAIDINGMTGPYDLPAGICTVSGNMMDFTDITGKPASRTAIEISAPSVTVNDNQIYTRGAADPLVSAFKLHEPAVNLNLHDNQVRNAGTGLMAYRASAVVTEVKDDRTFLCPGQRIPMERRQSPRYQGWHVVWLRGGKVTGQSVVESFDPETLQFRLTAPAEMQVGDALEIYAPSANWDIHDNSFSGCLTPVALDGYGSSTSLFRENVLIRGAASPVKEAVMIRGQYRLLGNQFVDYDGAGSATLSLYPDRLGRAPANLYQDNLFQHCALPVQEAQKGLWETCRGRANAFVECGGKPAELKAPTADLVPRW